MDRAAEQAEFREASGPVGDKVFVAVAEENGRHTLLWALQNLAKDSATIVLAHVHRPSQVAISAGKYQYQLRYFWLMSTDLLPPSLE